MSRALLFLLALATTASTPACVWWRRDPKLFVYSDPPGARVFIDGQDSGFTTPVVLEPASSLRVSVEKPGYKRAVRPVDTERYFRIPKWNDGGTADFSLTLPIFFTFHDFIFPFQFSRRKHPRRLYFQLEPMEGAEVPHSTKPLLPASSAAASRSASAPASQPTSERATQPTSERATPP
ncbi:MAG TPA: PEGA domain-containing protein, partial [Planctomycetota bacterium]|nr:PEGA domain-containing protein [Planctomycetota bacterium]